MADDLVNKLCAKISENADAEQAKKMSAYMQDKFVFLGVPKPLLKDIMKPFLSATAKSPLDWNIVMELWNKDFREAQYVAVAYLEKHQKEIMPSDIERLKILITTKSWWETVDSLDALVGIAVLKDEGLKQTMRAWSVDENMWLRRVAIDFQQKFKDKTDADLLAEVIGNNFGSSEFFINKAIGWSLRDYSKVNPKWVSEFVARNQDKMAKLSVKEALKNIG